MNGCVDARAMLPEAALDLLAGNERAEVLHHLEECPSCRELMHELSAVSDELVLLAPSDEPPAGFEQRVLARILPGRSRTRWPVVIGSLAAALLAVAAFAAGQMMQAGPAPVQEVAMRSPSGDIVGDAYVHREEPNWVFVAVPGWTDTSDAFRLRVTYADGTTTEVAGSGSWGAVLPSDSSRIHELALVGADGRVWCTALVPI